MKHHSSDQDLEERVGEPASLPPAQGWASVDKTVFGVSAGIILIYDLVRVLTGAVGGEELVAVRESEEL